MKPTKSQLLSLLGGRSADEVLQSFSHFEVASAAADTAWIIPVRVRPGESGSFKFELLLGSWGELRCALALLFPDHLADMSAPYGDAGLLAQAADFATLEPNFMFELCGLKAPRDIDTWRRPTDDNIHIGTHPQFGIVRVFALNGDRALVGYAQGRRYDIVRYENIAKLADDLAPENQREALELSDSKPKSRKSESSVSLAMSLLDF